MKKLLTFASMALVLLQFGPATAVPGPPSRASLTVVSDDNYPPYIFRQPDGSIDGYLVDAWKLWERKTGVTVRLVATDWAKAKVAMAAGQADVIDTIFRTPEREQVMDFTAPYADLPVPIYVQREIGGITNAQSLQGFLVAAKAGDACIEQLQAAGVTRFEQIDSYAQIVAAAAADQVRIFCMDEPPANFLLYRAGIHAQFRKAFVLYTGQFHRAVKKGDASTLALVQSGFDAISPSEAKALHDKWMGTELAPFTFSRNLIYGLAAALCGALLILGWGLAMRRVVRRRTAELIEQRQRLRTLLDTLPDLVWLKDLEGRYVACNKIFEQFAAATEDEVIGKTDYDFADQPIAEARRERDRLTLERDGPTVNEEAMRSASSGYRGLFETVKTPMRDASGRVVGVLGIARDVTQQRESQERLRRLNRLHRVLNGVSDTIATTRDRRPLFDAVCRILAEEGDLRMAWIGEPDAAAGRIRPVARAGVGTDYLDQVQISMVDDELGRGTTGVAMREGRSTVVKDLSQDPSMRPWRGPAGERQFRSCAAFPIKVYAEPRAVLSVYSSQADFFDTDELQLLERLALQVGMALEAMEADAARSRAETELRASEERFSLVFRTSPVGLALGRLSDGSFVDVNDAWLNLFKFERKEEAIGRTGPDLNLWCDLPARERVLQALRSTGQVESFDTTMRRRDGSIIDVAFAATRIQIGDEHYMLASIVDISLRRQAAKTLQEQAQQLERLVAQRTGELNSIFQALPDLYFRFAADGTILDYRAGRENDLYSSPDRFLGQKVFDVLPSEAGATYAAALQAMRETAEPTQLEYTLPLPSGETTFEARLLPFRNGEVICVVRNISDRRAYEQARERARQDSERLSQLRSEFLANMSHEIRTPLNGIMGLAQIGLARGGGQSAIAAFTRILDLSKQLLAIINDVLDFSKIDANRLAVESVPVNLHQLVDDVLSVVRESAAEKGLTLAAQNAPDLPQYGLCDPLRLRQILLNFLSNAIKFTERGSVELRAGREADDLVLRVSDTGVGIAEQQLPLLFMPFQQADSSTTRRFGGTGLGLSISRRLAQLMGGDIRVQSQLGQGSVFELRLPWREVDAALAVDPEARSWRATDNRLKGISVLVAEDNGVNQIVVEAALTMEGASVTIVSDGQQAIDRVAASGGLGIDLVLMDVQMPIMDGYAATRRIHELAPHLPVVGQTAHAMAEERERCLSAGMVAHVAKPLDLEQLVATVLQHARPRLPEGATKVPL
jgi:PAS domain S-box-containing protein